MANLTLQVTLTNGSLDVEQSNSANQMPHGQSGTITWQLTGNAVSGTFTGFTWKQQPPTGVFGTPTIVSAGTRSEIQMSDSNTDPNGVNSTGTWIYQLSATIDGKPYSTSYEKLAATTKNPTIKNN